MTRQESPIGKDIHRPDGPQLVRGAARYVGDLPLPGALSVAFVRCTLGHARVTRLSLDRAQAMPGVVGVFGPHDLPILGRPMPTMVEEFGVQERPASPLVDEALCAGDAVAVVVAEDPYRAADAVEAVEVDYEELPTVLDPSRALDDGAPLVHADVPANHLAHLTFACGDVDAAFSQADVTIREHFSTRRASNASIEPRGVAALPGGEDGVAVTLWDSTQTTHVVRATVAAALGLSAEQVRVVAPCVGGGFGAKGRSYPEEVALAALALHLGRPCRWEATRREDFLATSQGHGVTAEAELAAKSDGTLLGLRATLIQDGGAYMNGPLRPPQYAAQHLLGPYHMPAAEVRIDAAYTNMAQITPIRGGGREQGVFVIERLLDHLADRIGLDPLDVRQRNLLQPEEFPYNTHFPRPHGGMIVYDSGDFPGYLQEARELIGYDEVRHAQAAERKAGKYRGVAVTLYIEGTAMGREGARVSVGDDGRVTLALGSPDTGQDHGTTMRQICAAELGVPMEQIDFVSGDTRAMGVGTGTFASRFAVMGGNATALAAQKVHQHALFVASQLLEVAEGDLEICDGVVRVASAPSRNVTLAEVAQKTGAAGRPLAATHEFAPDDPTTYAGGAYGAVVEVDVETGQVAVERYVAVHDSGRVINPGVVQGQLHGAITMGIGEALSEMMTYDETGRLLSDSFEKYAIPRADQVPHFTVKDHPCDSRKNPQGIKGVGESGVIGTLPTIVAAVEDALAPLHLHLNELPIRSEDLARMCAPLRDASAADGGL